MTHFNEKIKKLRKYKDMTQEQLAEYMGVSPQAVSRWETGATCPDISALPQLAELFGVTVDELLGVDEKEKRREINAVITDAEDKINKTGDAEESIIKLREALKKYPNNERLLCSLMYALYVASEDEDLCKEYDAEIVSIAYRIQQHATDDDTRNDARSILFRHYCDTNRKAEAIQIADSMARIETCLERNIYWALEGKDRLDYLKERISDDLHYLLWDIWAYSTHAELDESDKVRLDELRVDLENAVRKLFPVE
ncbi:MAG: helix-turn-helix transcriptional regulator [Clostridia bacterium]|nr:helix-turn-helix transcriptional regulator [Clostridia bacterium]